MATKNIISKGGVFKKSPMPESSSGSALVVHDEFGTLDKTWQEIHDAMLSGGAVISADNPPRVMSVVEASNDTKSNSFNVHVWGQGDAFWSASSASGYPAIDL